MSEIGPAVMMPDKEAMTRALESVLNEPYACKNLYPLICEKLAGKEKYAIGIVLGLQLAIADFTKPLPLVMIQATEILIPLFIEAIAPDQIRAEALAIWSKVSAPAKEQ